MFRSNWYVLIIGILLKLKYTTKKPPDFLSEKNQDFNRSAQTYIFSKTLTPPTHNLNNLSPINKQTIITRVQNHSLRQRVPQCVSSGSVTSISIRSTSLFSIRLFVFYDRHWYEDSFESPAMRNEVVPVLRVSPALGHDCWDCRPRRPLLEFRSFNCANQTQTAQSSQNI